MENSAHRAIAIVGAGAILPDAPNVAAFWENVKKGRYSISEVDPKRWDPALYYDADPSVPDKTYTKIGGWVREFPWEPLKWRLAIPPKVVDAMDGAQKWGIACTREALEDYGYPKRPLDGNRTAVILGNAMAGEKHYLTSLRVYFPEYARELSESASFAALPAAIRADITRELHERIDRFFPEVTEDTMPGELANCIAGRIANIFNFHGPNFVCDAACASAMAAINSAMEGLVENDFDVAITGGIDRNMGAPTFVKFCKIGALSATGSRPYAEGADGFVMGEGAAIFVLKRLADAERDNDKIYAVLRGMGGSSDGKGKGITAPNPAGQKFAIERAWQNAGLSPASATLMEGHGTSTKVGDVVEVQSMIEVLGGCHLPPGSIALGSVKSNIGHLKGAAGAAGFLKVALALRDKLLPPSVHCEHPNPDIDFAHSPFCINTQLKPWEIPADGVRRAGLSAFGFGGTNFHAVVEEYMPGRLNGNGKRSVAVAAPSSDGTNTIAEVKQAPAPTSPYKSPLRGALVIGAVSEAALVERLRELKKEADAGRTPKISAPAESDLRAAERIAIDFADARELSDKIGSAMKALTANQPAVWKALRAQGIFRGRGPAAKIAFLYPGQGSQYLNMLAALRAAEPLVAETFAEADRIMTPILGKALSEFIFVNVTDLDAVAKAEDNLRQTAITQPAVLTVDLALTRMLAAYGIEPDFTMGHSLGEYGALVAAGALPFADALEAVSARGREMTRVSFADKGRMAAVFAPIAEIERTLQTIDGYAVIANINSEHQAVIGGASLTIEKAMQVFQKAGYEVAALPVSHAFHTSIVAPASEPLKKVLSRLHVESPQVPTIANTNGEFYPTGPNVVPQMLDILAQQVASPVQFIKGLRTLYDSGARIFVEVGPKKALQGFAEDVLGAHGDVITMFTNHPKFGDIPAFNQALCGLYAAGVGRGTPAQAAPETRVPASDQVTAGADSHPGASAAVNGNHFEELGRYFAGVLERGWELHHGSNERPKKEEAVAIAGAALGLPGTEHIFDDSNVARILRGEQFIDVIPTRFRRAMLDKHITRLVKSDNGDPSFETISDVADVIKLAGRGRDFDLEKEFGVSSDRMAALDRVTQLAIAVGIEALRDAGIPLVMRYKTTSKGTQLPDRWGLPNALRDDTGVIFASAFPGYDSFVRILSDYHADRGRREQLALLENLRAKIVEGNGHATVEQEIDRRAEELRDIIEQEPYVFDRRFLFRVLSMGHSQFAEFIGARGPNTQINAACASTTQAVTLAQDWIRAGRCRRVIVISADDVTSDHMLEWFGAGFLASGAAATDEVVEEAAIPFDRRRHGLIIGMGAAGLVVESAESMRERGVQPICEILSAVVANSAFHGSRLDIQHISEMMEEVVSRAEAEHGISRRDIAAKAVFVSHETYTPARGGSASAEIHALRHVFAQDADRIVIANTKGFTGHAMATGIEDVVAVKTLETGCVPPVSNFKEIDPELGTLNLSKGGIYPVEYALRLGAGFGSQISMSLLHWVPTRNGLHRGASALGYGYRIVDPNAWNAWLGQITGDPAAELEVVQRTLRVKDRAMAARVSNLPEENKSGDIATPVLIPVTPVMRTPAPLVREESLPTAMPVVLSATAQTKGVPAAQNEVHQDSVKEKILALVAAKTGYPIEMLDLDLDLEADLGVDTVKQAEVFASIREAYGIARDDQIKLREFPTLAHVIRFVQERRPDLLSEIQKPEPPKAEEDANKNVPVLSAAQSDSDGAVKDRILALVVEKTGYPKDMLDLDLDLEADLGVDTVKQAEMFAAIRDIYNIPRDEKRKLRDYPTLAHVIRFVYEQRPDLAEAKPQAASIATTPKAAQRASATVESLKQDSDSIKEKVLSVVAEKTGYPKDMLDLDLDLEADLGIDTVKQAEMLAAIRATYSIPRDENLKLRDFPTLAHVIKFAQEKAAGAKASVTESNTPVPKDVPTPQPALANFDTANRVPRRVPLAVLRPALDICKPTGVLLDRGRRVIVMSDKAGVGNALTTKLQAKGVEVLLLEHIENSEQLINSLQAWTKAGPAHGIYWLPALDREGAISAMSFDAWHDAVRLRVKNLYTAMRALYEQIANAGTFLISATCLGGQHGYDDAGAVAPLGGAVVGFCKAYQRERPDTLVKAVDFATQPNAQDASEILIEETLRDPGAVEIGYKGGLRWSVGLQEQTAADGHPGISLDKSTVFLITGAAGSIVSAITSDLAAASGGTFYLLDLIPEPDPSSPDLKRFANDKENLKRDLFTRIQARGERATPALVEKELAALERSAAAQAAIDAVRDAGGTAHYFSVNLTDTAAVASVVEEVRKRSGRVDVLLHAAGLDRSHALPDKEPREFDLVFDVKADGFFNLLHALGDTPLKASVAFSSIAGRFGNMGQTDYSSANDLLCKITSSLRTSRPTTRGIAIDWTAWGGIGMASRGSIPKVMEIAGIDMLPPEAGIPVIRRELTAGATRGEVVIAQRLGVLLQERDVTGGLETNTAESTGNALGPMLGKICRTSIYSGLAVETTLDPAAQPFLHDHQIDNTPVLPGVMGVEAFAEAALCTLPGWQIDLIENVNFLAPFKFYRNEPRTVVTQALISGSSEQLWADCCLVGHRSLANQTEPLVTTHFTGRVKLTKEPLKAVSTIPFDGPNGAVIDADEIYRLYFHGPAYQVIEKAWWDGARVIGLMAKNLRNNHEPQELKTIIAPRLIELCFQTAGLWEMGLKGRMGLPLHIDSVSLLADEPDPKQSHLYAIVTPDPSSGSFDAHVMDLAGKCYLSLRGYRTVEVPDAISPERLKHLETLMTAEAAIAA